ncbi:hypothetical protein NDU88_003178 [Pleurodeles waltl]|uniref:Uncharacterized protein n=1 Tax=Pleurodeles waltl TaxID=8319 RepID=A0AAV7QB14_PLEWA|nr:hypothetical protein NDU88_003178 [Pleurodeles waltl]
MIAKPSRGLRDSVPGTFPPGGPESEALDAESHPGAPEPELAEEASPSPVHSQPLHGAACWRKGVPTPGPGEAWSGLINSSMQVRPPWALWDPVRGALLHVGLEDEDQYRGSDSDPWPRAQMGPLSMNWQGKPAYVILAIWMCHRNAQSTTRRPGVSE